ncbi:MAG: TonB-dependent receptor [Bacteroidales bacterium]|nr:TonB-dependent receptor [Bacteroidales bacterium]
MYSKPHLIYRSRIPVRESNSPAIKYPFLVIILFLLFSLPLKSQDLQQKITLTMTDRSISDILEEITRISKIEFSYNPQELPVEKHITVNIKNKPILVILEEVLTRNGIGYQEVENHLVLKQHNKETPGKNSTGSAVSSRFTLSGYLRDKRTGEALIGANVYIKGTTTGAMTNGYGFYSLTYSGGKFPVAFSYMGYKEVLFEVNLNENTRLSVEIEEDKLEMREVEIVAHDPESHIGNTQMSEFRFSQKTLSQLPGFGGDIDIIRALQTVPGIQTFGDGSALYYVRGGNSDQNLFLIDEVPVYNPAHLFGFFSAFAPDAINNVQVYKGDFPAKFGGRLSSVIDIMAREGNMKRFGFSGNVGPYASNITLEGPIVKDRASFFISGRVSTLNWLNNLRNFNKSFDFRFFDINAKLNYRLNDNNRFFFTLYTGRDVLSPYRSTEVNSLGINWDNLVGTFRWNHLFSNRIFSNSTLNYSRYKYSMSLPQEQNGYWNSSISNVTVKTDLSWYLNTRNIIRSGFEITYHHSNPGNVTLENGNDPRKVPLVAEYHSMEYVIYASNDQHFGKRFLLRYGLRLPIWQNIGPTEVYYFDPLHQVIDTIKYRPGNAYYTAFSPEPRLTVQFRVNEKSSVKASYSRTTQFLQLLSNSTSPFTSLEVWAPSGPNIKPQTADQVALGYFNNFTRPKITLSAEGYYKWFHDHPDYRDHANLLFNTLIEGELRFGKAWSFGIELMLRKTTGQITGWIGYTWSKAMIRTPDINGGKVYPANYDHPNNICINLCWDNKKHWILTANWIYLTGGAITTPVGFFYHNGVSVPIYGGKNNDRLPDYHRLDVSATYVFNKPGNRYHHSVALTLYNAYGRFNPFSINFNKLMDKDDFVVPANLGGSHLLVPTSVSVSSIIPSINYKFRF